MSSRDAVIEAAIEGLHELDEDLIGVLEECGPDTPAEQINGLLREVEANGKLRVRLAALLGELPRRGPA